MNSSAAATWIAPADETDRGNLLGAAGFSAGRLGRTVTTVIEGPERGAEALAAARETGMLILPESGGEVLPESEGELALLRRAQAEGWRLLLLSLGADSGAASGELAERHLTRLVATPPPPASAPVPPAALRHRVAVGGGEMFLRSGLMHVECFEACFETAGAPLAESADLLDWGAGCGRMTAHLAAKAPNARISAADTDAEAVAWVGENLGVEAAYALPILPPTELASDSFDRVLGHSVFSHLEREAQDRWLEELARATRAGGHIAVSFNGPLALRWHLEHPLAEVPRELEDEMTREGIAVWRGAGWEDEHYSAYQTTFHSHEYVRGHWSRWAEVVAIHEAAAVPMQDIAVLRSR